MIIANLLGLLTALSREAYGPAFAGIFGAYLIALIIQRRKIPWREGVLVALSCIGAGLYGAYLIYAFRSSPGLAAWSAQNAFTSPDLFDFLAGFARAHRVGSRRSLSLFQASSTPIAPSLLPAISPSSWRG